MDQATQILSHSTQFDELENHFRSSFNLSDHIDLGERYSQETLQYWTMQLMGDVNETLANLEVLLSNAGENNSKRLELLQSQSLNLYKKTFEYFVYVLNGGNFERSIERLKLAWLGNHLVQQPTLVRQLHYAVGLLCIDHSNYLDAFISWLDMLEQKYPEITTFTDIKKVPTS